MYYAQEVLGLQARAAHQRAVELDPAVVQLASKWFGFQASANVRVHTMCGLEYMRTCGRRFGVVLLDIESGADDMEAPPRSFISPEALQLTKACLVPTGVFVINIVIEREHLNWPAALDAPQLYLNVFHPEYNNLFMMGMIEAAGLGWEGRNLQARLTALYIHQHRQGSAQAASFAATKRQQATTNLDGGYDYIKLARMAYYVNKDAYLDALHQHITELEGGLEQASPQPVPAT